MSKYKCKHCGSTEYELQYEGIVYFQMCDGKLEVVGHGGVLGGWPERIYCHGCGREDRADDALESASDELLAAIPETGYDISDDGFQSYENGRSRVFDRIR